MKITCDIIRDLLPLYAEDMVSQDSKALVDDHLCGCDECVKVLGEIKKSTPIPAEINTETLSKVKKTIVRRRALSVMASILTVLTLASFVVTYLFAPFQLTAEQALDDFYVREDGAVVIDFAPYVVGRSMTGHNENWFINQYSTRYDVWKGNNRKSIEELYGKISEMFNLNEINFDNEILITNIRHKNIISMALENVKKAKEALNLKMPIDIITIYIKDILEDLGEITGEIVTEDVINEIFSKFCLGK